MKEIKNTSSNSSTSPRWTELRVGDRMPDGSVYAGTSPDTNMPMFTTPEDAPLRMMWRDAMQYAAGLEAHGYNDWELPSKAELHVLFMNSAAIGGFKTRAWPPIDWYWSSTVYDEFEDGHIDAWIQQFGDGDQFPNQKVGSHMVRCVRRAGDNGFQR